MGETPLTATFAYDWQDRRVKRTFDATVTDLLCDGPSTVTERTNGEPTHTLHGPALDMPLERGGQYFGPDHLGSTSQLYDESGMVVLWQ